MRGLGRRDSPHVDTLRRQYLINLQQHTKRCVILYATNWTTSKPTDAILRSITEEDVQGMMEMIHGVDSDKLDLILHSPGGSAQAAESLVNYLRNKFSDIRVIIPQAAMSAATMLACAADTIVMGKHSSLGPIDPQIILNTQIGVRAIPAQSIVDQFETIKEDFRKTGDLSVWIPTLDQYYPGLLEQCNNAISLSRELVSKWLIEHMFKDREDRIIMADAIATYLGDHDKLKSHARPINRQIAKEKGLVIQDLEDDQTLQDLVLSVFHATTITFDITSAVKIIENHMGKSFVKMSRPTRLTPPSPNPNPQ